MAASPPPYETPSAAFSSTSFPQGYFLIKSRATGRVLDVEHGALADSTEIILWPEHDQYHVESEHWRNDHHASVSYLWI